MARKNSKVKLKYKRNIGGLAVMYAVSVIVGAVGVSGGLLWVKFGSHYIFYAVAALSLVNLAVAILVKDPRKIEVRLHLPDLCEACSH